MIISYQGVKYPSRSAFQAAQQAQQPQQPNPLAEQARRNQIELDETLRSRGIFPDVMNKIEQSPYSQAMAEQVQAVRENPVSMDDQTTNRIIGQSQDEIVGGYAQGRAQLRKALASAGALGSPQEGAKMAQMAGQQAGAMAGARRSGLTQQAQTNFGNRLQAMGALGSAQSQFAHQQLQGARGQRDVMRQLPIPEIKTDPYQQRPGMEVRGPLVGGPGGYTGAGRYGGTMQIPGMPASPAGFNPLANQQQRR